MLSDDEVFDDEVFDAEVFEDVSLDGLTAVAMSSCCANRLDLNGILLYLNLLFLAAMACN